VITPRAFGDRGRRRAVKLGIDPDRLPPGQSPTLKFPEFTFRSVPRVDLADWRLEIAGWVDEPLSLDWDEFRTLRAETRVCDLHCVTRWSKFDTRWEGVPARAVIDRAAPRADATHLMAHGYDGYTTNLPLDALDEALIAYAFEGGSLEPEHGGPARLLVPSRYLWKSAKWLSALVLMPQDTPGFWERNGYHNDGDPWLQQRHGSWR
jgi:DMSO/TMAO reductase YedYZ molybdopterin-dependent catalytic subunit